ncbi:hypothetical protein ACFYTS_30585 [Nocardia sp. NPDC004151]|uniref:hypothetical protein n=1 Tax=Nocardia sp. NPDC004151 TaxID=3364304 RepID=UPI0036C685A9
MNRVTDSVVDEGVGAGQPLVHLGQDRVEADVDVGEQLGGAAPGGRAALVVAAAERGSGGNRRKSNEVRDVPW